MVRKLLVEVFLILVSVNLSALQNVNITTRATSQSDPTTQYLLNKLSSIPDDIDTRLTRRSKTRRSTSSSSADGRGSSDSSKAASSLDMSFVGKSESTTKEKGQRSSEREGTKWRKWHRQCKPCPTEMLKKWRNPTINWICGEYQDARRSFKSACMMYFRNCQDGTMFVKMHEHRCKNETGKTHFFYDYKVVLSGDSTNTDDSSDEDYSSSGGNTFDSKSF